MANTLFYGDNLAILSQHLDDSTVDLVYAVLHGQMGSRAALGWTRPDGTARRKG